MVDAELQELSAARYSTKIDAAVEAIRRAILEGQLKPGTRLRQEELARWLGMSPTPIREALRRLQSEGLVVVEPHKGASVATFDARQIQEIYTIRGVLEGLAARLAAERITEEELLQLERVQQELEQAVPTGDARLLHRLNHRFHATLYQAAQSPILWSLIENLRARSLFDRLWVQKARAFLSIQEHRRILEALRARDPEAAERETRQHIHRVGQFLLEFLGAGAGVAGPPAREHPHGSTEQASPKPAARPGGHPAREARPPRPVRDGPSVS